MKLSEICIQVLTLFQISKNHENHRLKRAILRNKNVQSDVKYAILMEIHFTGKKLDIKVFSNP